MPQFVGTSWALIWSSPFRPSGSMISTRASNSTGVAILFKSNEIKLLNQVHIAPGRATLVDVESGGEVFGLINVYCPNNDDTDFLNNVFLEACSKTKSENLVFFWGLEHSS